MAANAGSSSLPVGTWSAESLPRRDSKTPRARSWLGTFVSSASSWTGTRSAPAADPVAAPETLETAPAQIEHCLVIPTFGYRIPGTSTWHIDVRGWVYQIKQNSVRKRFIKSLTKRIFSRTIEADPQTALVHLDRRLDMYLTRTAECTVNASLAAGPMDPAKEDMHPHEVRRDGVEPKVQPDPPSPRSPVTKHPGNVSPTTMGPVTLEFTGAVEGDGDQALDAMLEDDDEEEVEEEEIEETAFPEVQDGLEGKFRSNDNGNFHGSFQVEDAIVSKWRDSPATKKAHGHMHIKIGVSRDRQEYDAFGSAELLSDTGVSLISDVDDTIKHSNIGSGASAMFANAMLEAAQELPGMTETYNELWKAGAAIHYVSAAPWQVFPTVVDLLRQYKFPPGSFHMRTIFFSDSSFKNAFQPSNQGKLESINRLLQQFPNRKFILVGDSGEDDMFSYALIKKLYQDQIVAIFIRDVQAVCKTEQGLIKLSPEALAKFALAKPEAPMPPPVPASAKRGELPAAPLPRLKPDPNLNAVDNMEARLRFAFAGFEPETWSIFTDGSTILENPLVKKAMGLA